MKSIFVAFAFLLTATLAFAQNGEPLTGKLKISVSPGRAGVFIDGKYVGPAANHKRGRTYKVAAGDHEVLLVDPRYEESKSKITIHAGETVSISQKLKELPEPQGPFGMMKIKGFDKYAAVFLNGKFYAHADELSNFTQGMRIKPGEYSVRVEPMNGNPPQEEKVKVEEGKTVTVHSR
ncbi:MAG: PEGA domain-containing protein [Bryobacteraceae bacterium]